MTSRPADTSRELLVAVLAIETDLATPEAVLTGLHAWISDFEHPLIAILVEQQALPTDARSRLDGAVARYVETQGTVGEDSGRRSRIRWLVRLCRACAAAELRRSLGRHQPAEGPPGDVGRLPTWERGPAWGSEAASWGSTPPEPPTFLCPDPLVDRDPARAQVYALGVLLYTLITDEPPFPEPDPTARKERVQQGDFWPPRAVRPALSPTLEAICLKALALAPAGRYGSPAALADELDHWLAGEPVAARASSLRQRLRRWGRRHRNLTALALLLGLLGGVAASGLLVEQARHWLAPAQAPEQPPDQPLWVGSGSADQLGNRWLMTRDVLAIVTTRALSDWLGDETALSLEQRRFLETALAYYNMFSQDSGDDPASRAGQADAYFHMGMLQQRLGHNKEAQTDYEQSQRLLQVLVQENPRDRLLQGELAQSHLDLAMLQEAAGKLPQAQTHYKKGLMMYGRMSPGNVGPRLRMHIAQGYRHFAAVLLRLGRRQEAELALRQAPGFIHTLALPSSPDAGVYLRELVHIYADLATLLAAEGQNTEARELEDRALSLQQRLVAEHPQEALYHEDLAALLDERALAALQHKDYTAARDRLDEALPEHHAALANRAGTNPYRLGFRAHLTMRAQVLLALGQHQGAAAAAGDLLRVAVDPAKDPYTAARTLARCAGLAQKDGKLSEKARQQLSKAYADRAMHALQQALAGGFKDPTRWRTDPDLAALRGRADFQKLSAAAVSNR